MLETLIDTLPAPAIDLSQPLVEAAPAHDLFAERRRAAWQKVEAARCDFSPAVRSTLRAGVRFLAPWKKSLYGRTLADIKADDAMPDFFAERLAALIVETLSGFPQRDGWAVVTTPRRRHLTRNFATLLSARVAQRLGIPFHEDIATARNRHRMNAVFTLRFTPPEPNLLVLDDFVTSGQTLAAMLRILQPLGKNLLFFAGINNKL